MRTVTARTDPFNIFDAAAAAADYLCVAGGNLGTEHGQERAVLAYNHSSAYLIEVLGLERTYAAGVGLIVPVGPAAPTPPKSTPTDPPVDPGPPLGRHPTHRPSTSATSSSSAPTSASPTSTAALVEVDLGAALVVSRVEQRIVVVHLIALGQPDRFADRKRLEWSAIHIVE